MEFTVSDIIKAGFEIICWTKHRTIKSGHFVYHLTLDLKYAIN